MNIKIGTIISTHGLKGAVRVFAEVASFAKLAKANKLFYESGDVFKIVSCKATPHPDVYIVYIDGIENVDDTRSVMRMSLFVKKEDLGDKKDILAIDLVGLDVLYHDGQEMIKIGTVCDVANYGQGPMIEIKSLDSKNIHNLYPATFDFIEKIEMGNRKIVLKSFLFPKDD